MDYIFRLGIRTTPKHTDSHRCTSPPLEGDGYENGFWHLRNFENVNQGQDVSKCCFRGPLFFKTICGGPEALPNFSSDQTNKKHQTRVQSLRETIVSVTRKSRAFRSCAPACVRAERAKLRAQGRERRWILWARGTKYFLCRSFLLRICWDFKKCSANTC